jgi:hypothetical protein
VSNTVLSVCVGKLGLLFLSSPGVLSMYACKTCHRLLPAYTDCALHLAAIGDECPFRLADDLLGHVLAVKVEVCAIDLIIEAVPLHRSTASE